VRNRGVFYIYIVLLFVIFMGCNLDSEKLTIHTLGLEENFSISLPEGGEVIYGCTIPSGFNFRDYYVIKYNNIENLPKYNWDTVSIEEQELIQEDLNRHNEYQMNHYGQAINLDFLPDYSSLKYFRVNDPNERYQGEFANLKYAYFMLDVEKGIVYIDIVCIG